MANDLVFDPNYASPSDNDLVFNPNYKITDTKEIVESFINSSFDKKNSVTESDINSYLRGVEKKLADSARADIKNSLVNAGINNQGHRLYTTTDIIDAEESMIRNAKEMASKSTHNLTVEEISKAIEKKEAQASKALKTTVKMTDEQKSAIAHGLSSGDFAIVQGSAGAGKSFSAEAINIAYSEKGYDVIGAAVAMRAVKNLQDETGIKSQTISKLIYDLESGKTRLNDRSVIVIDEAGQVGTKQFNTLLHHANAANAKIVATGEDKQLEAIQQGGALRHLSRPDVVGCARIEAIVRQNSALDREAVMNLRDGKASRAIAHYDDFDLINFSENKADAIDQLVSDWKDYQANNPGKESLIIAHRNQDVREINDRVREFKKAQGEIKGPEYVIKGAHGDNEFDVTFAVGDRIRLNKNDAKNDLVNGDIGTVNHIEKEKDGSYNIYLKLDRGVDALINTKSYSNEEGRTLISGANAMTVYSSQGITVKGDTFVLQTASMDRANTYVAASRAKDSTHMYVPSDEIKDLRALVKSVSRDNGKTLVTDSLQLEREQKMDEAQKREEAGKKYVEQQKEMAQKQSAHTEPLIPVDQAVQALKNGEKPKVVYGEKEDEKKASQHRSEVINDNYPFHKADALYADEKFSASREALQTDFDNYATAETASMYYDKYQEMQSAYKEEMQIAITAEHEINEIQQQYGMSFSDIEKNFEARERANPKLQAIATDGEVAITNHYRSMNDKQFESTANAHYESSYNQRKDHLQERREIGGMKDYYVEGVKQPDSPGKTAMVDRVANALSAVGATKYADAMRGISEQDKHSMRISAEKNSLHEQQSQFAHNIKYAKSPEEKQFNESASSLATHSYNARRYKEAIDAGRGTPELKEKLAHAEKRIGERANEMAQLDLKMKDKSQAAADRINPVEAQAKFVNNAQSSMNKFDQLKSDVERGREAQNVRDSALDRAGEFKNASNEAKNEAKSRMENKTELKIEPKADEKKEAPSHNSSNNRRMESINKMMKSEREKHQSQEHQTQKKHESSHTR